MFSFFVSWYKRNLSNPAATVLLLQFISIFIIVYYFHSIFTPLIAALVLAFMLERPVSFFIKHGASRLSASITVMIVYIMLFILLGITIIPPAFNQLSKFANNITTSINDSRKDSIQENNTITPTTDVQNNELSQNESSDINIENTNEENTKTLTYEQLSHGNTDGKTPDEINREKLDKQQSDITVNWIINKLEKLKEKLPEAYKNIIPKEQLHEIVDSAKTQIKNWISPILTTQLAPFILDTVYLLVYFLIVPIFTFYMLKDKDKLLQLSKKYLSNYNEVTSFWIEMNKKIAQYLNGKIIHIILISILNGSAFALLGLNYSLLLGIGVGISVVIPYVGAIIITVPVIAIGLMQFGLSGDFAWLIGIYIVIQFIDGYLITPMIFSETLNLDPFSILVAIVVFGGIWGIWGVILAIPLATFVKTIFTMWPVQKIENN